MIRSGFMMFWQIDRLRRDRLCRIGDRGAFCILIEILRHNIRTKYHELWIGSGEIIELQNCEIVTVLNDHLAVTGFQRYKWPVYLTDTRLNFRAITHLDDNCFSR